MIGKKVHLSTLALITVAMFDLVTTLVWLNQGMGEGNPLFAWLASHGSLAVVMGKLVFLIVPLLILEYARTVKPKTAEFGTWVAAGLYAFLYVRHLLELR